MTVGVASIASEAAPSGVGDWLARSVSGPMAPGSVVLHAPTDAFQAPGGGEVQLARTGRHLDALGVRVRPFVPWVDRLESARLLHLFGLSREGLNLARVAKARGLPVVISPISWYEPAAIRALADSRTAAAVELGKWLAQRAWPTLPRWKRSLLTLADAILPNSEAEGQQLCRLFAVDPGRVRPVPNGVDPRYAGACPDLWRETRGDAPFVLYVGRIEPRKNVLGLVQATRSLGLPLVVIGAPTPGRADYAEACRAAGGAVDWVGPLAADDPRLASAFAAARVLALPSWFETPGLAALEGAAAGAAVVVTPYGSAREYFGPLARYSRPDRPDEVRRAIAEAWEGGPAPGLARHVIERFSWSRVARRTAEVYDQVAA